MGDVAQCPTASRPPHHEEPSGPHVLRVPSLRSPAGCYDKYRKSMNHHRLVRERQLFGNLKTKSEILAPFMFDSSYTCPCDLIKYPSAATGVQGVDQIQP